MSALTAHCRHYSFQREDPVGPHCALGIDLTAPGASKCCWPEPKAVCERRENYSKAELEAEEAEFEAAYARTRMILPHVPGWNKPKDRKHWGTRGSFSCPACQAGTMHWARSSYNGHVHAACTSPNCFAVIQ